MCTIKKIIRVGHGTRSMSRASSTSKASRVVFGFGEGG
jgi:hypothetical protein